MNYQEAHQEYVQIIKDCNFRNIPAPPEDPYSLDSLRDVPDEVKEICIQLDQLQIDFIQEHIRDLLAGAFDKYQHDLFQHQGNVCCMSRSNLEGFTEYFYLELVSKSGRPVKIYLAKDGEIYADRQNYGLVRIKNDIIKNAVLAAKKRKEDVLASLKRAHNQLTDGLEPKEKELADQLPYGELTSEIIQQIQSGEYVYMGSNASHTFSVALRDGKFHHKAEEYYGYNCHGKHVEVVRQAKAEGRCEYDALEAVDQNEEFVDITSIMWILEDFNPSEFNLIHEKENNRGYEKVEVIQRKGSDCRNTNNIRVYILGEAENANYDVMIHSETSYTTDTLAHCHFGSKYIS